MEADHGWSLTINMKRTTKFSRGRLDLVAHPFTTMILCALSWCVAEEWACASPDAANKTAAPKPSEGSTKEESADDSPYGFDKRPPWTTSTVVGSPEPPLPYELKRIFPKLKFASPIFYAHEPGTDRLVVAEHDGKIHAFSTSDPDIEKADLFFQGQGNLYAFSFHPRYSDNGQFFTFSPTGPPQEPKEKSEEEKEQPEEKPVEKRSRVSRWRTNLDHPRVAIPEVEDVIVEWPSGGHNGGEAIIGPDGYLYVATGDGSSDSDTLDSGQGVDDLLSVIMRLDVENPDPGKGYSVPPDNPFVDMPDARPEIWAFGFRNPYRLSFDAKTGRLYVGDVGQDLWEMIWDVQRGGNYGWSVQEGTHLFHPNRERGPGPILPPVIEHHHTECRSITGGYVYYGDKFPELQGAYVYGDYEYGKIWALRYDGDRVTWRAELTDTPYKLASFAVTRDGEIITADYASGELYSLERSSAENLSQQFPRQLSATGIFSSVTDQTPAPGVLPYSVNAPGWADGAHAQRFVCLPDDSTITFNDSDAPTPWGFKDGTVTVQTLSLDMKAGDPQSRRHIETRIIVKQQEHWVGYTYLWNEEQTDAALVEAPGTELTLTVKDAAVCGGERQQIWRVPSRNECMFCHSRASGFVLGLNTHQLNRTHNYDGIIDNQLRALGHAGVFGGPLEKKPEEYKAFPNPYDSAADLTERARTYLAVNCGICHVTAGGGNAKIVLSYGAKPEDTKLFGDAPLHDTFGLDATQLVSPGAPHASALFYRMSTVGRGRMPRVGSSVPDDRALALLAEWITQLDANGAAAAAESKTPSLEEAEASALAALRKAGATSGGSGADVARSAVTPAESGAINTLLASERGALLLQRHMVEEPATAVVRSAAVAAALAQPNPNVRDLFERFVPPSQRLVRLGNDIDPQSILDLDGDAARGRALLDSGVGKTCKTCHRVEGVGGLVGPDLAESARKPENTRAELLTSILQPSRKIDPKYAAFVLVTLQGEVVTGLLESKTDAEIVLRDAKGEQVRVPAPDVAAFDPQDTSLMPDMLLRDWTAQQAADLLAYLASFK